MRWISQTGEIDRIDKTDETGKIYGRDETDETDKIRGWTQGGREKI